MMPSRTFFEFFAGGGMVRAGLGAGWRCDFANDIDGKKALAYQENWGAGGVLSVGDIRHVQPSDLPGTADLAWASFPCQDLSLAGAGAGLRGARSGTFYPFWAVMRGLIAEGRGPQIIALENVCGMLTSRQGEDFRTICIALAAAGYRIGALVIDAELFLPQSRPRLFLIGVRSDLDIDPALIAPGPMSPFHSRGLCKAVQRLEADARRDWLWWNLPTPPVRTLSFADILEETPTDIVWHTPTQTAQLLALMSPLNLAKVAAAKRAGRRMVGGVYKRTRPEPAGRVVRAEVRFDAIAGCLRTPNGGSSRQTLLVVEGDQVRSRLISARETARLMGLPESYKLPRRYTDAYHLTGDGVAVPVVRFLAATLFEPILAGQASQASRVPTGFVGYGG